MTVETPANAPRCRSCRSPQLTPFLSLGDLPLPDALLTADQLDEPEPRYPLDVAFCAGCSLVQLLGDVPATAMFVDTYLYYSSFSEQVLQHAATHVAELVARHELGPEHLVVEVASNDGYLLRNVLDAGVRALGVDPSPGPAAAARALGIPTVEEFFGRDLAERLLGEHGPAAVMIANNVMAHVPDLDDFVGGFAILLADDGVLTVENPSVQRLVEETEFDTIYHEHVCYYSCTSVDALVRPHGLHLNDVRSFPDLHGGTLRWTISKQPGRSAALERMLASEVDAGVTSFGFYEHFADRVATLRGELRDLLTSLKADGRSIAAYGAAAKGTVLLNHVGIGTDLVDVVVDRNPHKHGYYMPGVHIPIAPPERLLTDRPDLTLLLAWNFTDEIVRQQQAYLEAGGRFIRPVPAPTILEGARAS